MAVRGRGVRIHRIVKGATKDVHSNTQMADIPSPRSEPFTCQSLTQWQSLFIAKHCFGVVTSARTPIPTIDVKQPLRF